MKQRKYSAFILIFCLFLIFGNLTYAQKYRKYDTNEMLDHYQDKFDYSRVKTKYLNGFKGSFEFEFKQGYKYLIIFYPTISSNQEGCITLDYPKIIINGKEYNNLGSDRNAFAQKVGGGDKLPINSCSEGYPSLTYVANSDKKLNITYYVRPGRAENWSLEIYKKFY